MVKTAKAPTDTPVGYYIVVFKILDTLYNIAPINIVVFAITRYNQT
jgi:hypothetical protein